MKHYAQRIKHTLMNLINEMSQYSWLFSKTPERDFTRKRKLDFEKTVTSILNLGSSSISNELLDCFKCPARLPSASAFVQRRSKLPASTMEFFFREFTEASGPNELYRGYRLMAVDGSDLQIATNPDDADSYFPGAEGQKPFNLLHLNAIYDLCSHLYVDVIVEGKHVSNEHKTFMAMVDRSKIPLAIVVADRGYESYNNMAHVQEKGWKFLLRVKDSACGIVSGLKLPDTDVFDMSVNLLLTRKQTNEAKELFKDRNRYRLIPSNTAFDYLPQCSKKSIPMKPYELSFRIVRFKISANTYETVVTNLDSDLFSPFELKDIYAMRWGIETSFRDLKYTVGFLHFHAKKVEYILQEIFARLIMYNFSELITSQVLIQKENRKYAYKANFSAAVHICRQFFRGNVSPPIVEALIARFLLPVRPGRCRSRKATAKAAISFVYRVA